MRLINEDGTTATLYASALSPRTGEPEVTLRIGDASFYRLHDVKVTLAPKELPFSAKSFTSMTDAIGELRKAGCLPCC